MSVEDSGVPARLWSPLVSGRGRWNGTVELVADKLTAPMCFMKPSLVLVCPNVGLFCDGVPDQWIDAIFLAMLLCQQHKFMVLTRHADRMRNYCGSEDTPARIISATGALCAKLAREGVRMKLSIEHVADGMSGLRLPNVALGVSCEDQGAANERISHLIATPAEMRFVSLEPLLGPVDLSRWLAVRPVSSNQRWERNGERNLLDLVIVGGERGPRARPMHPDWVRTIRDQCVEAGVPFFFKQWGEWAPVDEVLRPGECTIGGRLYRFRGGVEMWRCGRRRAGAPLDGRLWREWPNGWTPEAGCRNTDGSGAC